MDIRHDDEALLAQQASSFKRSGGIREQILGVGDYFQFYKVSFSYFTTKPRYEQGFLNGGAPSSIGEDIEAIPINEIKNRFLARIIQIQAPDSHGHHRGF